MRTSFNEILAKLTTELAINRASIVSNPEPYLSRAAKELTEARICFANLERALSPDTVFDYALDKQMHPINIQGEALLRCNAALKVLRDYMEKKP